MVASIVVMYIHYSGSLFPSSVVFDSMYLHCTFE